MKTVIEMAREANLYMPQGESFYEAWPDALERFAELARADEREKYKWDIHSCGPTCQRYACVSMREAVAAEREACAKVCDRMAQRTQDIRSAALESAAENIRARRNT